MEEPGDILSALQRQDLDAFIADQRGKEPSKILSDVMMAVLVLLGYEYEYTRTWGEAIKEAKKYTFVQRLQLLSYTDMEAW